MSRKNWPAVPVAVVGAFDVALTSKSGAFLRGAVRGRNELVLSLGRLVLAFLIFGVVYINVIVVLICVL